MSKLSDWVFVILGIAMIIVGIGYYTTACLPVVMRGYEKYGVIMKPEDVLKLEALEKGGTE